MPHCSQTLHGLLATRRRPQPRNRSPQVRMRRIVPRAGFATSRAGAVGKPWCWANVVQPHSSNAYCRPAAAASWRNRAISARSLSRCSGFLKTDAWICQVLSRCPRYQTSRPSAVMGARIPTSSFRPVMVSEAEDGAADPASAASVTVAGYKPALREREGKVAAATRVLSLAPGGLGVARRRRAGVVLEIAPPAAARSRMQHAAVPY